MGGAGSWCGRRSANRVAAATLHTFLDDRADSFLPDHNRHLLKFPCSGFIVSRSAVNTVVHSVFGMSLRPGKMIHSAT